MRYSYNVGPKHRNLLQLGDLNLSLCRDRFKKKSPIDGFVLVYQNVPELSIPSFMSKVGLLSVCTAVRI